MTQPTTLITGAAKRVGAHLARHLAAEGHALVLHYRQSAVEAEALAAELRAAHGTIVRLVQADLEDLDRLGDFWQRLPDGSPVTQIIHNASHYTRDTLADFTLADLRRHMAVNLEAPLLLTQGFMAQLPPGVAGNVIVLGDGLPGWSVSPHFFTYAVSKHGWASLIDLLAAAVAPRARANVLALGPTLEGAQDPEGLFDRLAERAALKRTSSPEEVAAGVDFLMAQPGITGQVLSLANGFGLLTARPVVG